jgi:choline dehydrogenase-like flavoprotein
VTAAELAPFYDELTRYIGVSGADDDLTPFFGSTSDLQPPLPLSRIAARFLSAYAARRASMRRHGVHVGRLRSAILTADHRDRPAHQIHNQEFFQPNIRSIYHPGHALAELRAAGDTEYRDGYLVTRFSDDGDHVNVSARNLGTGQVEHFSARHLMLAAGALNTARLVLASNDDHATRLTVLDNPLSYVPLLDWRLVGAPADVEGFAGAELCLVHLDPSTGERVQGTFYGLAAPLRGDLFAELPLSLRGNVTALRYLVPALGMLQMFHPDEPAAGNSLSLAADQRLEIRYVRRTFGALERLLIARFRRAGFLGAPGLVRFPMPGSSMHYAGPLPMRNRPEGRYQTDRYGRLPGSGRIRVVDGAAFPRLPSKNHTFTMMANAMRIARHLREHVA